MIACWLVRSACLLVSFCWLVVDGWFIYHRASPPIPPPSTSSHPLCSLIPSKKSWSVSNLSHTFSPLVGSFGLGNILGILKYDFFLFPFCWIQGVHVKEMNKEKKTRVHLSLAWMILQRNSSVRFLPLFYSQSNITRSLWLKCWNICNVPLAYILYLLDSCLFAITVEAAESR